MAGLLPLHGRPVLDQMLCGRIDFFRRQKHYCPYARAPCLADGKGERGGALIVGKVGDGVGVMVAEGEVEVLEPSPKTLGGSGHGFPSTAPALPSETLTPSTVYDASNKNLGIKPPFGCRRLTVSSRSPLAQGATDRCHLHSSSSANCSPRPKQ